MCAPSAAAEPQVRDAATSLPKFAYSIHGIASGAGKLAFALPTKEVYRGFAGMRLPAAFRVPDKFGIRAGADYGFMSTTLDQGVALHYSGGNEDAASTVLAIQMDEANRGALIAFLSYYRATRPAPLVYHTTPYGKLASCERRNHPK